MSCCHCCTNTLNLGCVNSCTIDIDTGIIADLTNEGTWILELTFGRRNQFFSVDVLENDPVIFTLSNLNEEYTYQGVIIDPAGTVIIINKNGIDYDCIQFQTKIGNLNTNAVI